MPITRAQAEAVLVGPAPTAGAGLVGGVLARTGFDMTGDSPVAGLSYAITAALLACDVTPDDVTAPDDDDVARLPASSWLKFVDIAWLRLLEMATGGGSSSATVKRLRFEDYEKEYEAAVSEAKGVLKDLRDRVRAQYRYGAPSLWAGSYRLGGACRPEF